MIIETINIVAIIDSTVVIRVGGMIVERFVENLVAGSAASIGKRLPDLFFSRRGGSSTRDLKNEVTAILENRIPLGQHIQNLGIKMGDIDKIRCLGIANWGITTEIMMSLQENRVNVEMLLLAPECEYAERRTLEEGNNVSKHVQTALEQFDQPTKFQYLTIFTYEQVPRFNIVFIDTRAGCKKAYAIAQHYSYSIGGSSPQIVICKRKNGSESPLYRYYDTIYNYILNDEKTSIAAPKKL